MKPHGQFCSVARALDLLGERWTLLVVRELLCGSTRFADLLKGIPRVSRTMLSARLKALVEAGVVERLTQPSGPSYRLTDAGRELAPLITTLGTWGQRWLPRSLDDDQLDIDALTFDMRRRVCLDALPTTPTLLRIEARHGRSVARRFMLVRRGEASLCDHNEGFDVSLTLKADLRTLTAWWRGDITLEKARAEGLSVEGRRDLARAFPRWFDRYLFAHVAPAEAHPGNL